MSPRTTIAGLMRSAEDLPVELFVDELGVEAGAGHPALADEDRLAAQRRQHLDAAAGLADARGADEDQVARAGVVVGLEAVELRPPAVAIDGHVEPAQARLIRHHAPGGEDEPRAGREDGLPAHRE